MTSKEFAKLLGVSQATISRALNDSPLVTPRRKELILAKAQEYGFELNPHAQSLKTNRTGTVGVLFTRHFVSMSASPLPAHLYDHIQRELIKHDYEAMLIYDSDEIGGSSLFERIIRSRKVDGLITMRAVLSQRELSLIDGNKFPCVSMLNELHDHDALHLCYSDGEHGGYLAGRHLGAFGDYEMMYVGFDDGEIREGVRRLHGFRRGLAEHGRTLGEENILFCYQSVDAGYRIAMENLDKLRRGRYAIFTYNDSIGLGIVNALVTNGIDIPGQTQLIGFDDIPLASWIRPSLSTVHIPLEEMVPNGCGLLRNLMEGNPIGVYQEKYLPSLVLRDTTLCP